MSVLQVRIGDDLEAWLVGRAARALAGRSASLRARTELELWRGHLAAELARHRWSLPEIGCIAAVCNGTAFTNTTGATVAAEIVDAFRLDPGTWGDQWGVDEGKLREKVLDLGPTTQHALSDALSRWWEAQHEHDDAHSVNGWARVGIRVADGG